MPPVNRRHAEGLNDKLRARAAANDALLHSAIDGLPAFALAMKEENAAGGQVVTAPTKGAAGVIPAMIRYYLEVLPGGVIRRGSRNGVGGSGHRRADQHQRAEFVRRSGL